MEDIGKEIRQLKFELRESEKDSDLYLRAVEVFSKKLVEARRDAEFLRSTLKTIRFVTQDADIYKLADDSIKFSEKA